MGGELGGNRVDLWKKMKSKNIGLITFSESEVDQIENMGEEEAKSVMPRRYEEN